MSSAGTPRSRASRYIQRPTSRSKPGGEALAELTDADIPLPMGALAYLIEQRARMHGLVMLELLGHFHPLGQMADTFYVAAMSRRSDEIDAVHERVQVRSPRPTPER